MPLQRTTPTRHDCVPVPGEPGRFYVKSRSAAKEGKDEEYIVDVLAVEETDKGKVTGTCPCKGWQVRKTCSHVVDATAEHERLKLEREARACEKEA